MKVSRDLPPLVAILLASNICLAQVTYHENHVCVVARSFVLSLGLTEGDSKTTFNVLVASFSRQERLLAECLSKATRHSAQEVREVFLSKAARQDKETLKSLSPLLNPTQRDLVKEFQDLRRSVLADSLVYSD